MNPLALQALAKYQGSAAWAVALNPAVPCYAEGQAICGFSQGEAPPMSPTPEIGAG